ncbi:MAG: putative rane protein [Firmicutes bacterium]|nr:putative rane protein [Bacillota bacterium]
MKNTWKNFSKYRFLLMELVKKEIKLKYRRSYLGILWTLLEPILTTAVLAFFFGSIKENKDPQFPVYIMSGRLLYSFFSDSTKAAMKSIRTNSAMIKKVYVPKYIYPLSAILSNYVIFLISMIVLFLTAILFKVEPTIYLLQIVLPMFLLLILALGIGMMLATMAVFFRDLEYLWGVILMLIMYTSAIFYKVSMLNLGHKAWMLKLNPLYVIIANFRCAVFGTPMSNMSLLLSAIYSFGSLIVGFLLFYRKQDKFILNI